jgi:hypothetical protein
MGARNFIIFSVSMGVKLHPHLGPLPSKAKAVACPRLKEADAASLRISWSTPPKFA